MFALRQQLFFYLLLVGLMSLLVVLAIGACLDVSHLVLLATPAAMSPHG